MKPRFVSQSLIDQLRSVVHERWPGSLEDSSFLLDLASIVDCEMEKVVERVRTIPVMVSPELVHKHGLVVGVNGSQKSHPGLETPCEEDKSYGSSYFRNRNDRLVRELDKLLVAGRFGDTEWPPVLEAVRRALANGS
jgi:hypothetical protein